MKKLITFLVLILALTSTSMALADVCVNASFSAPYQRVAYRHWVRERGWVVDYHIHRLAWNRYHHTATCKTN